MKASRLVLLVLGVVGLASAAATAVTLALLGGLAHPTAAPAVIHAGFEGPLRGAWLFTTGEFTGAEAETALDSDLVDVWPTGSAVSLRLSSPREYELVVVEALAAARASRSLFRERGSWTADRSALQLSPTESVFVERREAERTVSHPSLTPRRYRLATQHTETETRLVLSGPCGPQAPRVECRWELTDVAAGD